MIISWKRVIMTIIAVFVILCAVVAFGVYHHFAAGPHAADQQITTLIQNSDQTRISQVAMDEETKQFLLKLSPDTKVLASDNQGSVDVNGMITAYFPCVIDGLTLNVYMKAEEKTWMEKISPKWHLYRASLQPAHILPDGNVQPGAAVGSGTGSGTGNATGSSTANRAANGTANGASTNATGNGTGNGAGA